MKGLAVRVCGEVARINIEDSLYRDGRFLNLVAKLGNVDTAIGAVVRAFTVAQKFWVPDKRPIPSVQFKRENLPEALLEVGLCELRDDGASVYVCGSESQFAWLFQRVEAGRKNKGKKRERKETTVKRKRTEGERVETSYSPSFSPSVSNSDSGSNSERVMYSVQGEADAPPPPTPPEIRSPIGFFVANYVNAYQLRYGAKARPALGGKTQGQIKRFLQETPLERACQLIQTYLAMSDQWFITKAHDFGTFIENQSKVGLALDTGKTTTRKEAQQAELQDANTQATLEYMRRKGMA
jgi:hypothetical protein